MPVEIARHRRGNASSSWVAESKQLAPGVITARVVLSGSAFRSTIRVVNYSRRPLVVNSDLLVGVATPVDVLSDTEPTVSDNCVHIGALGGNTFFSTMDLRAGYWHTVIRE